MTTDIREIKGKVALVTGGAAGIGFAFVKELLRDGLKNVAIVDISEQNGQRAIKDVETEFGKNRAIFIKADITKADQFEDAFKKTIAAFNGLDFLLNNAGVFNDTNWEFCISINCNAVVRGCLLAAKYMGKNKGGRGGIVVNTASILGLQPLSACPIYTGTKHFVVGLTRSLGQPFYYNLTGIKFLAICPGVTETSLVEGVKSNVLNDFEGLSEELDRTLLTYPTQSVDHVGQALITIITQGGNGSCWVPEGKEHVYPIFFPERHTMRDHV